MDLAFVLIAEPLFERRARLLIRSIRRWCGKMSDVDIYAYAPLGDEASPQLCQELWGQDIPYINEKLNQSQYVYANKSAAANHLAAQEKYQTVVVVDSDMVFTREPTELVGGDWEFTARPEDLAGNGLGVLEPDDYWQSQYRRVNLGGEFLKPERTVRTTIEQRQIIEYYNSGLFAFRDPEIANKYSQLAHLPNQWDGIRAKMREQVGLSAVVTQLCEKVKVLPPTYNYPLHFHVTPAMWDPLAWRIQRFSDAVSLHYHQILNTEFSVSLEHFEPTVERDAYWDWLSWQLEEVQIWKDYEGYDDNGVPKHCAERGWRS